MKNAVRILLTLAVPMVALLGGITYLGRGYVNLGIGFAVAPDGFPRVAWVEPGGPAWIEGFRVGMIVTEINGVELVRQPIETSVPVQATPASPEPSGSPVPSASASPSPSAPTPASPVDSGSPSPFATPAPSVAPAPSGTSAPSASASGPASASASPAPSTSAMPNAAGNVGAGLTGGGSAQPVAVDPNGAPTGTYFDPPVPTVVPGAADTLVHEMYLIHTLTAVDSSVIAWAAGAVWPTTTFGTDWAYLFDQSAFGTLLGVIALVAAAALVVFRRLNSSLGPLVLAIGSAIATPFLAAPLTAVPGMSAWYVAGVSLVPLGMLPLALQLCARIREPATRRSTLMLVLACTAGAIVTGLVRIQEGNVGTALMIARLVLVAAIPLVPGLVAARPNAVRSPGKGLLRSAEYAIAGATPAFALVTPVDPMANWGMPLTAWLIAVVLAARFTVRPLARLATRATVQRDLVVAATEAERARVAADIHDDALQELTLLVRRLDTAGDTEGAEMARGISDRLRAICGDLRLPILDDLGVGPALEWLVERVERMAGGEVRLERTDATRLPPDVELAFFRIAQEALANATRHGKPPILVRFRTSDGAASLSVDDAGPGIAPDASAKAEEAGRFGLLNMAQRAEAIGAILDVRRWPSGGTHVALEWRAA